MNKIVFVPLLLALLWSCEPKNTQTQENTDLKEQKTTLKEGNWRFVLQSDGGKVPFFIEITQNENTYKGTIKNADENLELEGIELKGDSLIIPLHIFDAALLGKIQGDSIVGVFRKHYAPDKDQSFTAYFGQNYRFTDQTDANIVSVEGKWRVQFTDPDGKTYPAIGIFKQDKSQITGTFLTETGDYRYLEGNYHDGKLQLSTFDGNHAFLFTASLNGKQELNGEFWSGKTYKETWTAQLDPQAELSNAYELTYLKEGYDKLSFSFPDLDSNMVSLEDPKFKDKVVIVQIFGTWCPNCMDETAFFFLFYNKNQKQPVEIVGLAYERKPEFAYAKRMIQKVIKRFDVNYTFLVAGINDKKETAKTLPMLNQVISYPTTIFIDKKGKVRKIHTGFSGPGTGEYYQKWREDFNSLMSELLNE